MPFSINTSAPAGFSFPRRGVFLRRDDMRRALSHSRNIIVALAAFCILFTFTGAQAGQSGAAAGTIERIDRYSGGLRAGMTYSESLNALGKPYEKKDVPGGGKVTGPRYFATWRRSGYSVDAQFDRGDRIVSYGIHWFGESGKAPKFEDLLEDGFTETSVLGTRTAVIEGDGVEIRWRKTPVPNSEMHIDVLTVEEKDGEDSER